MPSRHRALLPELRRGLYRWRVPRWRMAGLLCAMLAIVALPYFATRTSHRLEWYIIALIAIEIGLSLYDRFLK